MTEPERRPSVRALATGVLSALAVIGVTTLAGLTWVSSLLEQTGTALVRDARSMELITASELALLAYQQMATLELLSQDPVARAEARAARAGLERDVRQTLEAAQAYAASERERELLRAAEVQIAAYLRERSRLEEQGLELEDLLRSLQAPLRQALTAIESLREVNEQEVDRAYRNAQDAGRRVRLASLAAAATGLSLLVLIGFWTRNALLRPIVAIRDAIDDYRLGQPPTSLPADMPKELAEIATAFEGMSDKLARRREEQSAFLAGVAHELRNPLTALANTTSALDGIVGRAGEPAVAILRRQLAHLTRLVDDLLDVARVEGGDLALEIAEVDLRVCVSSVMELYASTATRHVLDARLPVDPVVIEGDAQRIEQVLGNLLSNAIKYSPHGGAVTIELRASSEEATVAVTDCGIGIASADVPVLFRPFQRSPDVRDAAPGAGLGLAVVERIVAAHGGAIEVDSTVGQGSTFTVHLPRRQRRALE